MINKNPRRWLVLVCCSLTLLLSGCPLSFTIDWSFTGFQHPLVNPDDAKFPKEFYGSYRVVENASDELDLFGEVQPAMYLHVGQAEEFHPKGFFKAVTVVLDEGVAQWEEIYFAIKVKDIFIVHKPLPAFSLNDDEDWEPVDNPFLTAWNPELVESYELFALRPIQDGFEYIELNDEFIKNQVRDQKLAGQIKESVERKPRRGRHRKQTDLPPKPRVIEELQLLDIYDPFVTATPKELRSFFKANLEALLKLPPDEKPMRLERIK